MPPIYTYAKILKWYINPDELPNMNIFNHPDYPNSPQTENDSFELGKLWEVPEYPYHYLMVEKMPNSSELLPVWAKIDRHLKEFSVAIWETIDILVSTLLLQDPQAAADNYKEALHIGTLVLPSKLPKEILPFDRAKEIQGNMFKYYNIKNWNAMFDIICDQNWLHTKAMALKPSAFNPLSIGKLFDAKAEEFGMRMFNIPKVIKTPDVLGVLSHGLDTIGKPKLKQVMTGKQQLTGLDVHIMDMEAQNVCRRLR